jgi:hypothetical protein
MRQLLSSNRLIFSLCFFKSLNFQIIMAITLKEGDKAPDFKGLDQNGKEIGLSDFKGKKLVLYLQKKSEVLISKHLMWLLRDKCHIPIPLII